MSDTGTAGSTLASRRLTVTPWLVAVDGCSHGAGLRQTAPSGGRSIRSVMPVHVRSPPGGGVTAPFAYARADDRASIRQSDVSSCGRRDPALPRMGAAEGGAVLSGTACLGADSARTGGEERGPEEE